MNTLLAREFFIHGLLHLRVQMNGINDLDKFRFYSDEPTSIEKIEKYSDFFTMLSLAFSEISYKYKCEDLVTIKQRLSLPDYLFEIAALVQDLRANGVIPVIVNTPYFLKQDRVQDPQTIAVEYAKVEQSARANDCQAAMEHLKIAKGLEPERVQRDVIVLNTALREFASANKLAYIDTYTALDSSKKEQNFVDPVHPSAVGHQLIARQLSDSVLQLLHGKK